MSSGTFSLPSTSSDHLGGLEKEFVCISGILWKWTNYLMGWQERYFELRNGILVYYKSESEKQFGSRGSITLCCATVEENEEDGTRFGVATNGVAWYLKAESLKSKNIWLREIKVFLAGSQFRNFPVYDSACTHNGVTRHYMIKELKAKIGELEKSRELVRLQVEKLQQRFNVILPKIGVHAENISLREEGLALDITTSAILRDVNACIDLLYEHVNLSRLFENGTDKELKPKKNTKSETGCDGEGDGFDRAHSPTIASSTGFISDSEWHDAVESEESLDHAQDMKVLPQIKESNKNQKKDDEFLSSLTPSGILTLPPSHPLTEEINRITFEQLRYAKAGVEDNVWELFSEEGEMRMYKMELEVDGFVCDPLKATHFVKGVTAREYIHFFYEPKYKEQWDETIDKMNVIETLSPDTSIIHQIHKRVWPASQRESLFWSHVRQVNSSKDSDAYDLFMVCNHDTQHIDVPLAAPSNVRVGVTVAMVCQTIINKTEPFERLTRDDVQCRVIYVAQVHPGGWVPSSALRVIYKREYPKFLRGFTKYVVQQLNNRPVCL